MPTLLDPYGRAVDHRRHRVLHSKNLLECYSQKPRRNRAVDGSNRAAGVDRLSTRYDVDQKIQQNEYSRAAPQLRFVNEK